MTLIETIEIIKDAVDRGDSSINCTCGPNENDPECPWSQSQEKLDTLRNEAAVAILRREHPKLVEALENV